MKGYLKILWQFDDYDLPRVLEPNEDIQNLEDLKTILEAAANGKNKVLSITNILPEKLYLNLYIDVSLAKEDHHPMLMLSLSKCCNEQLGENWALMYTSLRHEANMLIFDVIRCSAFESILKEEGSRLYFQEFLTTKKGQHNSILHLLAGIIQCVRFNIPKEDRTKAALMEIGEN